MVLNSAELAGSAKTLAHIDTQYGTKMVIYERELRIYAKTGMIHRIRVIRTTYKNKPAWELEIILKGGDESALLVTSKNKPRQFKQLNYLVEFLNDQCPDLDTVVLGLKPERK